MRNQGLRPAQQVCCGENCLIYQNQRSIDGQIFSCRTCRRKYSVRTDTLWEDFRRTPLILLVRLVFSYFAEGIEAKRARRRFSNAGLYIGYSTMKRIYKKIRSSIERYMFNEIYTTPFRGRIQIDEALFTHRSGDGKRPQTSVGSQSVYLKKGRQKLFVL